MFSNVKPTSQFQKRPMLMLAVGVVTDHKVVIKNYFVVVVGRLTNNSKPHSACPPLI
jgi:hypothetical protein